MKERKTVKRKIAWVSNYVDPETRYLLGRAGFEVCGEIEIGPVVELPESGRAPIISPVRRGRLISCTVKFVPWSGPAKKRREDFQILAENDRAYLYAERHYAGEINCIYRKMKILKRNTDEETWEEVSEEECLEKTEGGKLWIKGTVLDLLKQHYIIWTPKAEYKIA